MDALNIERAPFLQWTITQVVSGSGVNFHFGHIENEPRWLRSMPGRIATDPCTGDRTLIRRTDGQIPLRRGKLTMHFGVENSKTPDQNLAHALALWNFGGPLLLTTPRNRQINFVFDDEGGDWEEVMMTDRGYRIIIGIAEIRP